MNQKINLYDTTLRDGSQGLGVSFSVADKIQIAKKLDAFGIHTIEGGWPGSNPKDIEFFKQMKNVKLSYAKLAAFGSTRRAGVRVENEDNVLKLLDVGTPVVTIFGKSWTFHVSDILKVSFEENLKMISETVAFLKKAGREVVYDAEHFFDGVKADAAYALQTLVAAAEAGADCICLCDTNGGTLPSELRQIIRQVKANIKTPLGIHAHNDSGLAVANALAAVEEGVTQVQGTINGLGERTGNADLCSIIPNLQLKMNHSVMRSEQLKNLIEVSRFVDNMGNLRHNPRLPYVGEASFSHKGGMHVNAVQKNPKSFEHIDPSLVGAHRRILISELSGQSNILMKAREYGIDLGKEDSQTKGILQKLKDREHQGYEYESAEGSFEVLMMKILGKHKNFFNLHHYRVIIEHNGNTLESEATVKLSVNGEVMHVAAEGEGPVNALDSALRRSLIPFYPLLSEVELVDFKVRVLEGQEGTAARVRVMIESKDSQGQLWTTVGVSENIIEASMEALLDSIEYKLMKSKE